MSQSGIFARAQNKLNDSVRLEALRVYIGQTQLDCLPKIRTCLVESTWPLPSAQGILQCQSFEETGLAELGSLLVKVTSY